ncbi:hypothetical protein FDG2_4084 [Candidatus Protofrankia californiensis]|uniref:Uncharacterized protein n=1 Tax=Candidatus Protofrankia californiensis TaxID=1839754 RepID=A0A1C3P377_9ACTN|nr:hypothetical protein FDG2_4084 [Candidatus Protofrankia californiensis]
MAQTVAAAGFTGLYLEANPVTPERVGSVESLLTRAGGAVVDGCLIGPAPREPGTTRLYLAGPHHLTGEITALFAGSAVETAVIAENVGAASALKIAHSSFAKTSRVPVALAHALAAEYGVEEPSPRRPDDGADRLSPSPTSLPPLRPAPGGGRPNWRRQPTVIAPPVYPTR